MKLLHRIIQLQLPMILDHSHPISNGISMTEHIRSHMLNTPITKQILMQSLQVIRIMNLIILFNILQILIMISHQKIFIIHRMKNLERIPSPQTGQFLVHYSQHKQEQPENVDNLHESHEACGQNFQFLHKSAFFLMNFSV